VINVFQNWYDVRNKISKIPQIFEKLEHLENHEVIFWFEKTGLLVVHIFDQLDSVMNFVTESN
jgi:hypothetical protein